MATSKKCSQAERVFSFVIERRGDNQRLIVDFPGKRPIWLKVRYWGKWLAVVALGYVIALTRTQMPF